MAKSTEFGRANADYVTRSLSGISTGGVLVTAWVQPKNALTASDSRSNSDVFRIEAADWSIRGIVCNGSTNAAGIGNLNCNLMLFTEPGSVYVNDFAYYDTGGYTKEQLNSWLWVAWWIQPGTTFTMKQYLRVVGVGGVFDATAGGTDVSTDIPGADDPPTAMSWSDNAASAPDNAYLWHGTVRAMASAPTLAQLDVLCRATAPDAAAFGDWPLEFSAGALVPTDQSGNGRSVTPNVGSTFYQGTDVPLLATVYMGASAVAYSTTSPTPDFSTIPNPILANDGILLFVAQKPTTANGGTVTAPAGFTLLPGGSKLAAGGYGATTGVNVGNLNLLVYKKDTVTGSESGTISITTSDNNVAFAWFAHFRSSNGTYDFEVGTAEDTTAGNLSLAFGAINVTAGDVLIAAFAEPTAVTTPAQFSAQAISGSGLTAAVFVELNEPDSTLGNDIGGVSYVADITAGAGSTAVTVTATAGGTTTNVRGPGLLVRVRQGTSTAAPPPSEYPRTLPVMRRPAPLARWDVPPPVAAAAAAPPPPEAARAVRSRPWSRAAPLDALPPQLGVFTGTGFPPAVVPQLVRLRIAPAIPDVLPPLSAPGAPSPPAPESPRALPLGSRRLVPPLDVPPPQAGVFTGTGFPQLVPPVRARVVPPPLPFDAPPPIPVAPAPAPPPLPAPVVASLPRRMFTQDPPLPPLQQPAAPAPFVVRALRRIVHPFSFALPPLPPVVFGPPPEAPRAIRALKRIWRLILDVGWPATATVNYPVPVPPLHIVENDVVRTIADATSTRSIVETDTVREVSPMKTRKVGDTADVFSGTLYSGGAPRSLAGSTLRLYMWDSRTHALKINGVSCTVEPSGTGTWSYQPIAADVDTAGEWEYDLEETTAAGRLAVYPSSGYGKFVTEERVG